MSGESAELAWWQRGVVYQIYPRSFQDANGDGIGDLAGIISRLDHLVWLGVDALWLSPIFRSPMEDGGYDISDYTAVDPMFGTVADFDALVAAAHARDLRVILDFVPNHTSHRHPWFEASRSSRDDPRRHWYLWRDPAPDGGPPTNWRSASDTERPGSAWVFDEATGQYYMATFSHVQPDLNWANPDVRAAMHDVLRFWLDRGVDGFRVDMIGFLGKDEAFRDEPIDVYTTVHDWFRDSRYQFNRPETVGYLKELRAVVDGYPDRVLVGEMLYRDPIDRLISYQVDAGIDLPTNFSLITLPFAPDAYAEHIDEYDAATVAAGAWPNYCLGNHDMPRISRHGEPLARLALLMLLTLRGTPFLYYGDEIGMANVEVPPERRDDRWEVSLEKMTRDSVRTPMQWDAGPNAGFCPPGVEPWLPIADDHKQINVAIESADDHSHLHMVRRLLALRRDLPALATGSYRRLTDAPAACIAYVREHEGRQVTIVLNFGDDPVAVDVAGSSATPRTRVVLCTIEGSARVADGVVHLQARSGALLGHA